MCQMFFIPTPVLKPTLNNDKSIKCVRTLISHFCRNKEDESAALDNGLSSIAQEVRAVFSPALTWDTLAIAARTRQLVSAVSGLKMAGQRDRRWGTGSGEVSQYSPTAVQPGNGQGCTEGQTCNPANKRRKTVNNVM